MAHHSPPVAARPLLCDVAVLFRDMETAGGLIDRLLDAEDLRANGFSTRIGRLGERVVAVGISGKSTSLEKMTDAIVFAHKPQLVILGSQAIGLAEGVGTNTVLLASGLVANSSDPLELSPCTDSPLRRGMFWATDQLALGPPEVLAAIPRDLYAAAMWCHDHNVALEIAAVITRHINDPPPADVRQVLNQPSLAGRMGAFLGAAWRRPSSVPDLWRQKETIWAGREKLGDAIEEIVIPGK